MSSAELRKGELSFKYTNEEMSWSQLDELEQVMTKHAVTSELGCVMKC